MAYQISERDYQGIGRAVAEAAYCIFVRCGRQDDFCLQDAGWPSVMFGGWNRIGLNVETGRWWASASHCTPEFLKKFNDWKQEHELKLKLKET